VINCPNEFTFFTNLIKTKGLKMIGYTTIGVSDLDRSVTFYDALIGELGGRLVMDMDRIKFYGTPDKGAMLAICTPHNEEEQHCGNGTMVAIPCGSPEGADKLYNKAIELGAVCEGEPGQRLPVFYGGYVRDFDSNKLCFYHMSLGE